MTLTVTHHNTLTPAERQVVELWYRGLCTDKEMARAAGVTPGAIRTRVSMLLWHLGCPFGTRRDTAMLELLDKGLIEITRTANRAAAVFLCLLCLLNAAGQDQDIYRHTRARRGQPTRTLRTRQGDPLQTLINQIAEDFQL